MARYYLDTEFNGLGGDLISLALVHEFGPAMYIIIKDGLIGFDENNHIMFVSAEMDSWVNENVISVLFETKQHAYILTRKQAAEKLQTFFAALGDKAPHIIADWPDDIKYFCELIITGPGQAISTPHMTFEWKRVDAYPTTLEGAVQHNAMWDACALKAFIEAGG